MEKLGRVHWTGWTAVLAAVLTLSLGAGAQQRNPQNQARDAERSDDSQAISLLPDSPGSVLANSNSHSQLTLAQSSQPAQSSSQAQSAQQSAPVAQRPVGAAAAEAPNVSAIAASQPAGVAIAPAKQHRVRTIVLRTGAILGAGVAIGTVVALTRATPSKPPGAH